MNIRNLLWVEKYRPKEIRDLIITDPLLSGKIKQWIDQSDIPHLLLTGSAGCGKTTLAQILIDTISTDEADVLIINASKKNNVHTIREEISYFTSTLPVGKIKIVFLDECDQLTPEAQGIMRVLMEERSDHVRFVLACNYEHRIIPPIKSRCQHFRFNKPDVIDVTEKCATILSKEQVTFNLELLDKIVAVGYPDIRKIIQLLQQCTVDNVLQSPTDQTESGDYKFELLELIQADKWKDIRKLVSSSVSGDEWEDLYRFLYDNIHISNKCRKQDNWDNAIILIAEHLYKHTISADPEINCASLLIQLDHL